MKKENFAGLGLPGAIIVQDVLEERRIELAALPDDLKKKGDKEKWEGRELELENILYSLNEYILDSLKARERQAIATMRNDDPAATEWNPVIHE